MNGVTFGAKHSYDDFGLILRSSDISFPEPKTKLIDIPGSDGVIDLTEALSGEIVYKNRTLQFTFTVIDPIARWPFVISEIANYLHGHKLKIIRDADRQFFYLGRCRINQFQSNKRLASLVIDCDCEPYKYDIYGAGERWLWDPFRFSDGIIYPEGEFTIVSGETVVIRLPNRRKRVTPVFNVTGQIDLEFNGIEYTLPEGTSYIIPEIILTEGTNTFNLRGNGTVKIEYRGGSL